METFVKLENVVKTFPSEIQLVRKIISSRRVSEEHNKVAVAGVSLSIAEGESLGIVGSNGAGKSTLLHMIAGLSTQSSGSIEVNGKVTAIMTLGVGLAEESTGRENIYIDGELQGKSRDEIDLIIDEIIEFADIGEFIDQQVRIYSTGMKSRLAFAMISHIEPEILIIDEALSAGDANFSRKASARIKQMCASGKIVIIVSHGMQSIREYCNRCVWMEDGKVVMDGSPGEVTKAYIESVRSADEAALIERFRSLANTRSLTDGWVINDVTLYNGESSDRRALLEVGLPTRIVIGAEVPSHDGVERIRVRVNRLDDLSVFNETFAVDDFRLDNTAVGLEIDLGNLTLAAAIYMLNVTLEMEDEVCAENSIIFEVFDNNPPTGGAPVLIYPVNAHINSETSGEPSSY